MILPLKGSRDLIRDLNHNLILTLLRQHAPIPQQALARLSGLSPATVSGIIAALSSADWIEEVGPGEASGKRGGRRPTLLRLNAGAGLIVGVKVMEDLIATVITDLDATVLHTGTAPLEPHVLRQETSDPMQVIMAMVKAIEAILLDSGVDRRRIIGVGVGISGLIDAKEGISRVSRIFPGQRDVHLGKLLSDHLGFPTFIENDVRARTIAEHVFGAGQSMQHFVLVAVGRGIGAGIVVNGQIYHGSTYGAGELGHMCMDENGPLCECGNRGCLEAFTSAPALVQQAIEREILPQRGQSATIEDVILAADQGDLSARRLFAEAGHLIGMGIANMVNILSPECVFVVGEGTRAGAWLLDSLQETMHSYLFPGLAPQLVVEVETISEHTWARGAACVVLNTLFKSPITL